MASGGGALARLLVSVNRTGLRYVESNIDEAYHVLYAAAAAAMGAGYLVDTCTSQILPAAPQNWSGS
jgi:hypothetical protein